jgi:hypothetical protein
MLNVTNKPFMQNVIMPSVVLNVVAPHKGLFATFSITTNVSLTA